MSEFTYGAELEWSDVDRRIELPADCGTWDYEDKTIVNSDGMPNDPKGKKNVYGGEINTTPTDSIQQQIENISKLKDLLNPKSFYRANLHVHIGVPGLVDDIDRLQKLFQYILANEKYVYNTMLYRPPCNPADYTNPKDLKLAQNFDKQQNFWAKRPLAPNRVEEVLKAKTAREFYEAQFAWDSKKNKRIWHLGSPRAGINLRSLVKNGSIEFRIFPGTVDLEEIQACFEFAHDFTWAGLNDHSITAKYMHETNNWKFPKWQPFLIELERIWQANTIKIHPMTGERMN